jgi:hypothetical protein
MIVETILRVAVSVFLLWEMGDVGEGLNVWPFERPPRPE